MYRTHRSNQRWSRSQPLFRLGWRVAGVLAFVQAVTPGKTDTLDFRGFHSPLTIRLQKSSPAFAALEDARWDGQNHESPPDDLIELKAGTALDLTMLMPATPSATTPHTEMLRGMTISRKDWEIPEHIQANAVPVPKPQPIVLAANDLDPDAVADFRQDAVIYDRSGQLAPVEVRKQRLIDYYSQHDWSAPSVQERVAQRIAEEAKVFDPNPQQKVLLTPQSQGGTGNAIYVGRPEAARLMATAPSSRRASEPQAPASRTVAAASVPPAHFGLLAIEPNSLGHYVLKGSLQFKGGLAFTGLGETLTIIHWQDGSIKSEGQVRLQEGRFEIAVERIQGYVLAELRSAEGELVGYGEIDLYRLPQIPYSDLTVDNLKIYMVPTQEGLSAEIISAHSFGQNVIAVKNPMLSTDVMGHAIRANDEGQFVDKDMERSSSYLLRASAPNHWGSLAIGLASAKTQIRMFPNRMVDALINLTAGDDLSDRFEERAVIWGRVVVDGQPLEGAVVELAGDEYMKPIYFNSYIPDRKLETTSANGLFAFVGVTPGIQAVRAFHNGRYLPAEIIPAESHQVSYVELQGATLQTATVKVFDAVRPQQELKAELNIVGSDLNIPVGQGTSGIFQFPGGGGLMIIEADSGEPYELARVTLDRKVRHIQLPMVQRAWLDHLMAARRVNVEPERGVVVGFNQSSDFEVVLDPGARLQKTNVVYFDAQGNVIRDRGVKGGGFAIFNVPPGFRTVTVLPEKGQKIKSQVVISEPQVINIFQ